MGYMYFIYSSQQNMKPSMVFEMKPWYDNPCYTFHNVFDIDVNGISSFFIEKYQKHIWNSKS